MLPNILFQLAFLTAIMNRGKNVGEVINVQRSDMCYHGLVVSVLMEISGMDLNIFRVDV